MLPFPITTLDITILNFWGYYETKYGRESCIKIQNKMVNSNSLAKLCGLSISQNRPPTTHDFRLIGSNMFLLGSVEKITFAALIALREWNQRINKVYNMASQETVDALCRNIILQSRLPHL